jgi:hypothetical protein
MNIDFGVQVARPFEREGDVRCIAIPAGEVARTVHLDAYDRLGDAHNAIHAWYAENHREIAQLRGIDQALTSDSVNSSPRVSNLDENGNVAIGSGRSSPRAPDP